MPDKTILITGASGNLGNKLRQHLDGRYPLHLLDRTPQHKDVAEAELSQWAASWVKRFDGVDTVVHLAANPNASASWDALSAPNMDALVNVFTAAAQAGVRRIIYASSNHVMGGYQHQKQPQTLTTDIAPQPGAHYGVAGQERNSIAYGGAKLFGERMGKCYADIYGMSVIAVRIGWVRAGANRAGDVPPERDAWFRLMWLSNRDFCHLLECCIEADASIGFAVINDGA